MHPIVRNLLDTPVISASDLQKALIAAVPPDAAERLKAGGDGLVISEYNRLTILEMLQNETPPEGTVLREDLSFFIEVLTDFLDRYMSDQPEGHLWIVLSCVYLAMAARRPLHPQRFTHWTYDGEAYHCPAKDTSPGSTCNWCVCEVGI